MSLRPLLEFTLKYMYHPSLRLTVLQTKDLEQDVVREPNLTRSTN